MRQARLSPKQLAAAGWRRIDGGRGKVGARWRHVAGWQLVHCGHPTALWPWALYSPAGRMVCTGVMFAPAFDPEYGTAWPDVATAVAYVATQVAAPG